MCLTGIVSFVTWLLFDSKYFINNKKRRLNREPQYYTLSPLLLLSFFTVFLGSQFYVFAQPFGTVFPFYPF